MLNQEPTYETTAKKAVQYLEMKQIATRAKTKDKDEDKNDYMDVDGFWK